MASLIESSVPGFRPNPKPRLYHLARPSHISVWTEAKSSTVRSSLSYNIIMRYSSIKIIILYEITLTSSCAHGDFDLLTVDATSSLSMDTSSMGSGMGLAAIEHL